MKKAITILALLISAIAFSQAPLFSDGYTKVEVINPLQIKVTNQQTVAVEYEIRLPDTSFIYPALVAPQDSIYVTLPHCGKGNVIPLNYATIIAPATGVEYSSCYEVLANKPELIIETDKDKDYYRIFISFPSEPIKRNFFIMLTMSDGSQRKVMIPLTKKIGDYYFYHYKITQ